MIVVKIKGGLGNQMFEYAIARKLQMAYGIEKIAFETSVIGADQLRRLELSHFAFFDQNMLLINPGRIVRMQEWLRKKLVSYFIAGRPEKVAGRRENFWSAFFALLGIVQRDHSRIRESFFLKLHKNIYVNGWFQEAVLFEPIRDILIRDFAYTAPGLADTEICKRMRTENSVCVHVRRGDYINHPVFDVCHEAYYCGAMERIAGKVADPVFFIFSDDIGQVEREMKFPYPVVYVRERHEACDELFLMRQCRHFIMSNSTFSWWAQFLGEAEDKIVVAPARWRRDDAANRDIYMDGWILVDV